MNKYAVVFAGQGAQKPGMGLDLYEGSAAARAVFDLLGDEVKRDCFEADAERLRQTEVTQPAVYAMDMAAWAAFREALGAGMSGSALGDWIPGQARNDGAATGPCCVAGFSLGEYAAFTAAGVIGGGSECMGVDRRSLEAGLGLVRARSLLMKAAGTDADGRARGAMAAGMGERTAVLALVERARGEDVLEAVNFNSPQQTVVAGDVAAVERFCAMAKEDRGLGVKGIALAVSGAFHSPLMRPAAEGLEAALAGYAFGPPRIPVLLNSTGGFFDEHEGGGDINAKAKEIMVRQIQSPVLWQDIIERMVAGGVRLIVEVGPGKTLTGLAKKIAPEALAVHVEDMESLEEAVRAVKELC